jgi:hypothetical protein
MKVDIEIARQEVEKWLEYKRVGASKREAYKDAIDSLVDAVAFGQLTLEDDYHFVQHLDFPIEGDEPIEELKFKPRIKVKEIYSKMRGVKAGDADGRVMALIAALTGKPSAMVGMLETSDYSVSQNIALFFL